MKLADRVALVTGAGSGIGRATALLFAEEGAQVIVNDIDMARAQKTAGEIPPGQARAVATDVADSQAVRAMFAEVERDFGRVDILVNNAGIGRTGLEREGILDKAQARTAEARTGRESPRIGTSRKTSVTRHGAGCSRCTWTERSFARGRHCD